MERYLQGQQPEQVSMVPFCLDDFIGEENPVRFIREFVDHLDLKALGFQRIHTFGTGRKRYSPRLFLKLYLYGHLNRIRSSRMLERECRRNIELMWLLERLCPDHNTIAIFRAVNRKALVKVFKLFVRLSVELGLCSGERVCVDGTTIKVVNGMDAATSMELSQKKLEYAQRELEQVERYLSGMDEQDQNDQGSLNRPFALEIDPHQLSDPEELKKHPDRRRPGKPHDHRLSGHQSCQRYEPYARRRPGGKGKPGCPNHPCHGGQGL